MPEILPDRLPWFVAGPLLGLLIVTLYGLANRPMGAVGAYVQVLAASRREHVSEPWRIRFFGGIVLGGFVAGLARGDLSFGFGYGALAGALSTSLLIPVLLGAGLLMGYGARWAGGCTMGHGMCGSAIRSPGSLIATGTFMTTAVVVTWGIHLIAGGGL